MSAFQFPEFNEGEKGVLRFANCFRFRLGATNDEGWYLGQCRFSGLAPAWGELYAVFGDPTSANGPEGWMVIQSISARDRAHFLFYFRDDAFECLPEHAALHHASVSLAPRSRPKCPMSRSFAVPTGIKVDHSGSHSRQGFGKSETPQEERP